jgi:hypothetical protein
MTPLSRKERLRVLELVAEIAGEASQNTNVVWMIEFQEELVEKLYRKMVALLEEPGAAGAADDADSDAAGRDEESEPAAGTGPATVARPRPHKAVGKSRKAAKKSMR